MYYHITPERIFVVWKEILVGVDFWSWQVNIELGKWQIWLPPLYVGKEYNPAWVHNFKPYTNTCTWELRYIMCCKGYSHLKHLWHVHRIFLIWAAVDGEVAAVLQLSPFTSIGVLETGQHTLSCFWNFLKINGESRANSVGGKGSEIHAGPTPGTCTYQIHRAYSMDMP